MIYLLNVIFGIGHKHIYKTGDFMKVHVDGKLPDILVDGDKLPHIMTLIVIFGDYTGGCFNISSNEVEKTTKFAKVILFSLDLTHEASLVTSGIRYSFAFPVYGIIH